MTASLTSSAPLPVVGSQLSDGTVDGQGHVAPGQELTHYAPDGLECYLVRPKNLIQGVVLDDVDRALVLTREQALTPNLLSLPDELQPPARPAGTKGSDGQVVVVDFNSTLKTLGLGPNTPGVVAYRDLSVKGSVREATSNLFATLRWAESLAGGYTNNNNNSNNNNNNMSVANRLLLLDVAAVRSGDEFGGGVGDRMFRSASGKVIELV